METANTINPEKLYPVSYTIKQDGTKIYENTFLLGKDLTEKQIEQLNHFQPLSPSIEKEGVTDKDRIGIIMDNLFGWYGKDTLDRLSAGEMKGLIEEAMIQFHNEGISLQDRREQVWCEIDEIYKSISKQCILGSDSSPFVSLENVRLIMDAYKQARIVNNEEIKELKNIVEDRREKWISVSEKLPDYGVNVLTSSKYPGGTETETKIFYVSSITKEWNTVSPETITHWQPLPTPPLVEEKKGDSNGIL